MRTLQGPAITYRRQRGHGHRVSGGVAGAGAGMGGDMASGKQMGDSAGVRARAAVQGCGRGSDEQGCERGWRRSRQAINDDVVLAATAVRQKLGSLTASLVSSARVLSSFSLWEEKGEGAIYTGGL
jgi:hypothetical protein